MAQLIVSGNAKASQVLESITFSAGPTYNGVGTMKNMGDQEILASSAYLQEGYISLSIPQTGDDNYLAVNGGSQFTYVDALHCSAKNIIMGFEMLGLDGTATSDATAVAADIASGKIAYSKGQKLVGTMASSSVTGDNQSLTAALSSSTTTRLQWDMSITLPAGKTIHMLSISPTVNGVNYMRHVSTTSVATPLYMATTRYLRNGVAYYVDSTASLSGNVVGSMPSMSYNSSTGLLTFSYRLNASSGTLSVVGGNVPFSIAYLYA